MLRMLRNCRQQYQHHNTQQQGLTVPQVATVQDLQGAVLQSWMAEGMLRMLQKVLSALWPVVRLKQDTALVWMPLPHSLEH